MSIVFLFLGLGTVEIRVGRVYLLVACFEGVFLQGLFLTAFSIKLTFFSALWDKSNFMLHLWFACDLFQANYRRNHKSRGWIVWWCLLYERNKHFLMLVLMTLFLQQSPMVLLWIFVSTSTDKSLSLEEYSFISIETWSFNPVVTVL